ncbi:hypothetical protein LWI29_032629 [Acer saccharum]|uniref:Uncharacterized protein n=1 Tax=Acer saccharum TaxID=4024 RepID=A0AA39TBC7_ACESA|nr:hypothetical protein LWI29_032629 [Acer saccharum]
MFGPAVPNISKSEFLSLSLSSKSETNFSLSVQPRNQFYLLQHSTNLALSPRNGGRESGSLLRIEKERKEEKKRDCHRCCRRTRRPSRRRRRRPCSSTLSLSVVDAVFSYCPPPLLLPSFVEAAALAHRRRHRLQLPRNTLIAIVIGKNSRDRHVITVEGQVSRGQDKSTYGVGTFTITYSEKRISSPTTNKDDQLEQQIGFGHTRAHSGILTRETIKQSPTLAISSQQVHDKQRCGP